MKKFASVLLAALLVFALTLTAFAEDPTYTITINNDAAGHTYEAYQVFTGDLSGSTLSSMEWGTGVNAAALITALQADTAFVVDGANIFAGITAENTPATAVAVATAISNRNLTTDAAMAQELAKVIGANLTAVKATSTASVTNPYTITGLESGYYLVQDEEGSQTGDYDSATRYILEVVKDVTVTPKSSKPTVEKKVSEESYTGTTAETAAYGEHYNDVADYDIGDAVPFELIGTMPSTLVDYTTYSYTFTDTLSAGLTYNPASIHVYVDNNGTKTEVNTANYTVTAPTLADGALGGGTFTVAFTDVKTLTDTANNAITVDANSKIFVNYTATLNANAVIGLNGNPNEVYLTYSNNPNGTGTGTTPTDKVIVFTYELDVTKIDADVPATKLQGAEFQLYKNIVTTVGEETVTTKWYAIVVNGKLTGWTDVEANATTLTSDANGLFAVAGLDDGTYYLHESKAPTGYNILLTDVTLVIDATTVYNQTWAGTASDALTALTIAVNGGEAAASTDTNKGIVKMNVENAKGSVLPSTGGIGTTIFTVIGIAVMLGAAVLLIVRRRMQAVNG